MIVFEDKSRNTVAGANSKSEFLENIQRPKGNAPRFLSSVCTQTANLHNTNVFLKVNSAPPCEMLIYSAAGTFLREHVAKGW